MTRLVVNILRILVEHDALTWSKQPRGNPAKKYTGNFKCYNQPSKQVMESITSDLGMNYRLLEGQGEFCDGLFADI